MRCGETTRRCVDLTAVGGSLDPAAGAGERPRLEIQRFLIHVHPDSSLALSEHYPRVSRADGSATPNHHVDGSVRQRRSPRGPLNPPVGPSRGLAYASPGKACVGIRADSGMRERFA
jgi:hypothetical protein